MQRDPRELRQPGDRSIEHADILEENLEDLYENAPCGYLSTWPDGRIARINATLASWLGFERDALLDEPFTDLLTAGGRIHYETHFAPLLQLEGELSGITVDLVAAQGEQLPVFVTANVKTDASGSVVLVRITLQDARDRRTYEKQLLEERRMAEHERARVQVLASTLQRSLLPPSLTPPAGMDAAAYYHPASTDDVGGDFYDLFALPDHKWGFFLGDVCGKGATAAAVTSLTRYTLRSAAVFDDDPVAVLHNLDAVLHSNYHGDEPRFCTVVFGVLTRRDDGFDVHLASGGHPPALLLTADGEAEYISTAGGQFVGILRDPKFVSKRVHLSAGDTLVLYTDGLTEARIGPGTERYDDDGALIEFAAAHAPTTAEQIVGDLRELLASFGTGLEDDTAVMALGVARENTST
ncbi:PP2C family protein-serine/threonine phosphatase [Williamsia muralis]|uniref:SpoIIE family protein phosphatase n=1 Tax=Williamsia marianensis TaxID=85044 RepID=A0ABU4ETQ5_WILMA|nr:SpoIIE family protein phosphatase [Williamsia muralis]MDV7134630.1 SpoIIE family protein phosphatase [Williamsia muralis]